MINSFRPNIVIKGTGVPFAEEAMRDIIVAPKFFDNTSIDRRVPVITLVSKCARCLVRVTCLFFSHNANLRFQLPNVDIRTGVRDAAVPFKVLSKLHKDTGNTNKPLFGCNGVPSTPGTVRVGDYLTVKEWVRQDRM